MRHWKITLMRDGRSQRQWHLRGEAVSVGALPTCSVRLPRPAPDLLLEVAGAQSEPIQVPWNDAILLVEDVTCTVDSLLRQAKVRIETEAPRENWNPQRIPATLVSLCLLLLAALISPFLADQRPEALRSIEAVVAQMEAQRLAVAPEGVPMLEATRPQARLPGAPAGHLPLALVVSFGTDLTKLLRADSSGSSSTVDGKHAKTHPYLASALEFALANPVGLYASPASSLYRSPDLAGLFQPG